MLRVTGPNIKARLINIPRKPLQFLVYRVKGQVQNDIFTENLSDEHIMNQLTKSKPAHDEWTSLVDDAY